MTLETGKSSARMARRQQQRRASLRARIALATTITAVAAVLAVGFFAIVRTQSTQAYLGNQLQQSTNEKAESQIQALVAQETQNINQFFYDVDHVVLSTTAFTSNLLNQSSTFESGLYWDARQNLYRLPNGAWDNSNNELAAVFAPTNFDLTEQVRRELNAAIQLDLIAPNILKVNPSIVALYYISRNNATIYYPNIDLANVVPPDFDATDQPFYTNAKTINRNNIFWSLPYQDPAMTGLIVTNSSPVFDQNNTLRGVIGADVLIAKITESVQAMEIGTTGYGFMIDSAGRIISMPETGYQDMGIVAEEVPVNEVPQQTILENVPPELRLVFQSMAQGGTGLTRVVFHGKEYYVAYAPISSPKYSLGIIVPVSEMDIAVREAEALIAQENLQTQNFGIFFLLAVIIAALLISFGVSRVLTNPLNQLTTTAQKVREGDLTAIAPETNVNEVNTLSTTFNAMTAQLREMLGGLEERVAERTAELDVANLYNQRRAEEFEAIALIAREISESQDLGTLLPKITNVISERFGFYHVGVFLLDANQEYAVLRAANSLGGKRMLERRHQLRVGETGIVGYVTSQNKARIALDTGSDAVYFDNPDMPNTRSEMALPLRSGNEVIGALDVQSTEPNAFTQDDVETLSTLADQVSVAIQNANLYEETRNALAQSQALQQEFVRAGWSQFTQAQKLAGIRRSNATSTLLKSKSDVTELSSEYVLELPVNLRGYKVGTLKLRPKEKRQWTQDEIDIASAILDRAAISMENARLLSEAQRRAARERMIGDIAASISTSSNMEGILRTAVQVLGRRMGGAEVILEFGFEENGKEESSM